MATDMTSDIGSQRYRIFTDITCNMAYRTDIVGIVAYHTRIRTCIVVILRRLGVIASTVRVGVRVDSPTVTPRGDSGPAPSHHTVSPAVLDVEFRSSQAGLPAPE